MSVTYHIGRPTKSMEAHYDRIAKRVDTMPVDGVVRVPRQDSPSRRWFGVRARLNNFIVWVKSVDDDFVIVRIK